MDKKAIRTIVIIFAAYFIISSIIFYNLYMMRSKSVWSSYFDEVKDSQILNEDLAKFKR